MDPFFTTYRRDYIWPYVRASPLKLGSLGLRYSTVPTCNSEPSIRRGLSQADYLRLLESRRRCQEEADRAVELYCARPGPHTLVCTSAGRPVGYNVNCELQAARDHRAQDYLKQLKEKHPYLFNIIRSCPPDDLVTRVFKDRYRSVYMVDYCKQGEYPNSEYDALVRGAKLLGAAPAALPYCPCRSNLYASGAAVSMDHNKQMFACDAINAMAASQEGDVNVCLCGMGPKRPTYGRKCSISCIHRPSVQREAVTETDANAHHFNTEYRDVYNKLGKLIMSERIHSGNRITGRAW